MDNSFILLYRKSIDSRAFKNEGLWKVWTWCLMKSSYKKRWVSVKVGRAETEVEVMPGQFIFGRNSASKQLKMNPNTIWKRMQKLKTMQNLTIESNTKYSIISIINWDTYQNIENKGNIESNNQVTTKCQPSNTNNKVNNINKDKKEIYTSNFLSFWLKYPKKIGKGAAFKSYNNIKQPRPSLQIILQSIEEHQNTEQWENKQFIPNPATWLNQRRWEDEIDHDETMKEYMQRKGIKS